MPEALLGHARDRALRRERLGLGCAAARDEGGQPCGGEDDENATSHGATVAAVSDALMEESPDGTLVESSRRPLRGAPARKCRAARQRARRPARTPAVGLSPAHVRGRA